MSYNKLIQTRGGHISGERGLIIGCIFCLQVNRTITGGAANNQQFTGCIRGDPGADKGGEGKSKRAEKYIWNEEK